MLIPIVTQLLTALSFSDGVLEGVSVFSIVFRSADIPNWYPFAANGSGATRESERQNPVISVNIVQTRGSLEPI
jgi:hypothetical protein